MTTETLAGTPSLAKRPRIREAGIQGFLFLCGALSVLITVGILIVLGTESLSFFTDQQWENSNKPLAGQLDASSTVVVVGEGGASILPGNVIRVHDEIMEVLSVEGQTLTVVRGLQGTEPTLHETDIEIFRSNRVTLSEFLTGTEWSPQIGRFGVLPLITATLMTSLVAMTVALPLGLGIAIYLSEYATSRARSILKPVLEILAGIPTVVYGYFALTLMTPLLRSILGNDTVAVYNTGSAGIVIGILILPLVSSMSEDALSAVPRSLREASYALGATRLETAVRVVVPAAISGIAAAFILATSRAIGETMIVAIAAGAGPALTANPFRAAETMTGHMVRISGGDLSFDSIDYNSLFAIGLVLFFMTLFLNLISQRVVRRFREAYE